MPRAVGNRGNWFARIEAASRFPEINERSLPCIFAAHIAANGSFFDDGYEAGHPKWDELVLALQTDSIAILARDGRNEDGSWFRNGYFRVVRVGDVQPGDDGLRLKILDTICELRP